MDMPGKQGMVVPVIINLMHNVAPWAVGLLSVCALAAMQSTGAAYMSTAGGMLTRDLYKHFLNKGASHDHQKFMGRVGVGIIVASALTVATFSTDALVLLGGLAVAYGFQMWPSLIAVCYWPWLTRTGINVGLIAGIVVVSCTETIGTQLFGITAWGRWPWTMHSAGWGIYFNLGLAIIVSMFTQNKEDMDHKMTFHNFLREHTALSESKQKLKPLAWIIVIVYFIFAFGPGAVVGNTIFGNPNDAATWTFGMPSIWAWQILWWALGVGMMWFLAYFMEFSTIPDKEVLALVEDIGDIDKARLDLDKP
jgi:solute:Na+ symporter, SSS family